MYEYRLTRRLSTSAASWRAVRTTRFKRTRLRPPIPDHRGDPIFTTSDNGLSGGAIAVLIVLGVIYLAVFVLTIWAYVRIIRRAGYSGWWVLIGFVPIANFVMLLVFGFKEWPVQRELNALRAQVYGRGGGPQWYGGQPGG